MSEEADCQPDSTDENPPVIHVDIRLTRRIGALPPFAMKVWQGFKGFLGITSLAAVLFLALSPQTQISDGWRYGLSLFVVWQFWEHIIARTRYGTSHILVTTKGVCFTDENIYVRWNEIESWKNDGKLLRMKPKEGHGPRGFMAPKECDIPLTESNREFLLELFRERVPRWRPEAQEVSRN